MANRFTFDERGLTLVFQSESGIVGKDMTKRGTRVQLAARRQVGKDTHLLERSIVKRFSHAPVRRRAAGQVGDLIMTVGSDRDYALLHHEGTRPHVIRPRRPGGVMVFVKNGKVIFAKSVSHPGTKPNRYLSDNLPAAVT